MNRIYLFLFSRFLFFHLYFRYVCLAFLFSSKADVGKNSFNSNETQQTPASKEIVLSVQVRKSNENMKNDLRQRKKNVKIIISFVQIFGFFLSSFQDHLCKSVSVVTYSATYSQHSTSYFLAFVPFGCDIKAKKKPFNAFAQFFSSSNYISFSERTFGQIHFSFSNERIGLFENTWIL